MHRLLSVSAVPMLALVALSGCLDFGSDDGFDFVPGEGFEETGKTVHLKATVVDLLSHELAPGLKANMWAFCFAPVDATDTYSANAVEAREALPGDAKLEEPFLAAGWKCGVPGPTLRVQQGDKVIVEFSHSHFHPHTIHWHGQFVPSESDGVPGVSQSSVRGGDSFKYEFIAKRAGTLWYHCHVDTQLHVMQGLYGVIIVEPQSDKYEPKDIDEEYTLVFSTARRGAVEAIGKPHAHGSGCQSGFWDCENPRADVTPDIFLLNGHSFPFTHDDPSANLELQEGKRYRIRMLNAGTVTEEIHFHGHDVQVTHLDGNPLNPSARYYVDTVKLGPAERVDVVLEANNPGAWVYHTHVNDHETNCGKAPGGMHSSINYEGFGHDETLKSELPASCATPVPILPGDFVDSQVFTPLNGAIDPPEEWSFPVDLACAVKELRVKVALTTPTQAHQALTEIDVTILAPNGDPVETFHLGGIAGDPASTEYEGVMTGEYRLTKEGLQVLQQGNYTLRYGTPEDSQAAQATLVFDVLVDYHATLDDTKTPHLLYGLAGCVGYT